MGGTKDGYRGDTGSKTQNADKHLGYFRSQTHYKEEEKTEYLKSLRHLSSVCHL